MTPVDAGRVFLATTALEEYWDKSASVVFLGPWCLTPSREQAWRALGGKVAASRFADPRTRPRFAAEAFSEARITFDRVMPELARRLDEIHGTAYGEAWWRRVVGPWLVYWIHLILDRLAAVDDACQELGDVTTIGPGGDRQPPFDTEEFIEALKTDAYNLDIFARILEFRGADVCAGPPLRPGVRGTTGSGSLTRRLAGGLIDTLARLIRSESEVRHLRVFGSWRVSLGLALRSRGRILPLLVSRTPPVHPSPDRSLRNRLATPPPAAVQDEVVWRLLGEGLPIIFLEGFGALRDRVSRRWPAYPRAIFSLNAWYFDEEFKVWASDAAASGSLLLGGQHGGNYGVAAMSPAQDFERSIVDRYYTWGWSRPSGRGAASAEPMPAALLLGRPELGVAPHGDGVLYVATAWPRYTQLLPHPVWDFVEYLDWQRRFAQGLPSDFAPTLRVRLHREDMGWEVADRWRSWYPRAQFEEPQRTFLDSLASCRLYVCDHMSTTYAEALAARKPTILFWNPAANPVDPAAEGPLDGLRRVGILHDSPEEAAQAVASIYDGVERWWEDRRRQSAVSEFCDTFVRTRPDGVAQWLAELGGIGRNNALSSEGQ